MQATKGQKIESSQSRSREIARRGINDLQDWIDMGSAMAEDVSLDTIGTKQVGAISGAGRLVMRVHEAQRKYGNVALTRKGKAWEAAAAQTPAETEQQTKMRLLTEKLERLKEEKETEMRLVTEELERLKEEGADDPPSNEVVN